MDVYRRELRRALQPQKCLRVYDQHGNHIYGSHQRVGTLRITRVRMIIRASQKKGGFCATEKQMWLQMAKDLDKLEKNV